MARGKSSDSRRGSRRAFVSASADTTPLARRHIFSVTAIALPNDRAGLHHDFRVLTSHQPRGPCRALVRAVTELLFHHPNIFFFFGGKSSMG